MFQLFKLFLTLFGHVFFESIKKKGQQFSDHQYCHELFTSTSHSIFIQRYFPSLLCGKRFYILVPICVILKSTLFGFLYHLYLVFNTVGKVAWKNAFQFKAFHGFPFLPSSNLRVTLGLRKFLFFHLSLISWRTVREKERKRGKFSLRASIFLIDIMPFFLNPPM